MPKALSKTLRSAKDIGRVTPEEFVMFGMVAGPAVSARLVEDRNRDAGRHADQLPVAGFLREEFRDSSERIEAFKKVFTASGGEILPLRSDKDILVDVIFPHGWTRKSTGHYMYTDVLDEKGHCRGQIGLKLSDSWASFVAHTRFQVSYGCDDYDQPDLERLYHAEILDSNRNVLWRGANVPAKPYVAGEVSVTDRLRQEAAVLLKKCYPLSNDVTAYWDLEKFDFPPSLSVPPAGDTYTFAATFFERRRVEDEGYSYDEEYGDRMDPFGCRDFAGGKLKRRTRVTYRQVEAFSDEKVKVFQNDKAAVAWWKGFVKSRYRDYSEVKCTIRKDGKVIETLSSATVL